MSSKTMELASHVTPDNIMSVVYRLLEDGLMCDVMLEVGFDTPEQCIAWIREHSDLLDFSDPDYCWEGIPTEEFEYKLFEAIAGYPE